MQVIVKKCIFFILFFASNAFSSLPVYYSGPSNNDSASSLEPSAKFYKALLSADYDRARLMLEQEDIDLNFKYEGDTALNLLFRQKNMKMADEVIALGADINIHGLDGETPLHEAAKFRDGKTISKYIDLGADIYAADAEGQAPIHLAAFYGNISAIEVLKSEGKKRHNPVVMDKDGNTPLHTAAHHGKRSLHDSTPADSLVAVLADQYKGNIYFRNEAGRTPLHEAVEYHNSAIAKALLDLAEDKVEYVNNKDHQGLSPLNIAKKKKNENIIKLFSPYQKKVKPAERLTMWRSFLRRCAGKFFSSP